MEMNRAQELLDAGYTRELIIWGFKPNFYEKDDGHVYIKRTEEKEIGLILNEKYDSVEVFTCRCTIGCCGDDLGIQPFNLEKIHALIEKHYE
jgi:hypothetical protein